VGFKFLRLLFLSLVCFVFDADQRGCVISINGNKKAPREEVARLLGNED